MKLYKDLSKQTRQQMQVVQQFLTDKYGSISAEWYVGLDLLASNLELLAECQNTLKEQGVMYAARNGMFSKHPMLSVIKELNGSITKLLNEFGLTPRAARLMTVNDSTADNNLIDLLNG